MRAVSSVRRTSTRLLAVGAIAALATVVAPSGEAHAATGCLVEGSDTACWTKYSTFDYSVTVCDREADGNGVYAYVFYGAGGIYRLGDSNGSAAGCGTRSFADDVTGITLCEDDFGEDTCVRARGI